MAVFKKVRRLVANPHRRSRKRKTSNPRGHRRRLTAKQIKFFGTKRQKAGLKAARKRKRSVATMPSPALRRALANPRRKTAKRRRNAPATRRRKLNPALLITLGAVNPRGGSSMVAKRRKKARKASNPRRRRRTTRVVVAAPRRRNVTHRRKRRSNPARRHNPAFGMRGAGMTKAVVAGMAGMAVAKFLPTLVPGGIIQGNLMRTIATGASAFVAQMVAKAVTKDQSIADAVLFGGLIQTGSAALNSFLPGLASSLGLSGIMDADWTIPENPLRQHMLPAPAGDARAQMAGLARAYGSAY